MRHYFPFSRVAQFVIIATLFFLVYGYLCRLFGLYFFWESKSIGWVLFWLSGIFICREVIKQKKIRNQKTLLLKILTGLFIFVILVKAVLFFVIRETTAYKKAVEYIKTNGSIQAYVGTINGIFLEPYGSIQMSESSQGTSGSADLHFVVKGSKKYIDLNLLLKKDVETDWNIQINE